MSVLTEAMALTKPSLYNCFGNKERLFQMAFTLYEEETLAYAREALGAPTPRGVAEAMLRGALAVQLDRCNPRGCMALLATLTSSDSPQIRDALSHRAKQCLEDLERRFETAKVAGDLPAPLDPRDLAHYLVALVQSLNVQAGMGVPVELLARFVETILAIWPTP